MTPDRAAYTVLEHLRVTFGKLLKARAPERRRRAAGPTWCVPVVVAASDGEIPVAEVDVDESGAMSPVLDTDHVVAALQAHFAAAPQPSGPATRRPRPRSPEQDAALGGFAEADMVFAEIDAEAAGEEADVEISSRRLRDLFQRTDGDSLAEARKLLPHLLGNSYRRGRVLMMMAEVERRLGEPRHALGYLDAAAHELADHFDMRTLERAASISLSITGEAGFVDSPIRTLLHRCRARLRPLQTMFENPTLALVPPEHRQTIEDAALVVVLAPGEVLVTESDPSTSLFVVKSGVIGVLHERPARNFVRCCSPGWLLGESSVLVEKDPRCTATLRAEHLTEVWQIDAAVVRAMMEEVPALRAKIVETKAVHGLDSFFSAHASVGLLDSEVRNEMLKCIHGIQSFEQRTVVIPAGAPPELACLVARGRVTIYDGPEVGGAAAAVASADEFIGVRDALHRIPTARTAVAEPGTTLVFFAADDLRDLAARSPEQAVAVLERLG